MQNAKKVFKVAPVDGISIFQVHSRHYRYPFGVGLDPIMIAKGRLKR